MRVPVRLGVTAPTAPGVRRAAYYAPRRRLGSYGGDVRSVDPFALVFRGNMGDNGGPDDLGMTLTWPSDTVSEIPSYDYGLPAYDYSAASYEAPAYQEVPYGGYVSTSDILRTEAAGGLYPGGEVMIEEQPRMVLPGQIFGESAPPVTVSPEQVYGGSEAAPSSSGQWFQAVPAIAAAGATIATSVARVVQSTSGSPPVRYVTPTGQVVTAPAGGGPITYTIPATATAPAQRVTYNPATGQITAVPLTAAASMLPSVLQGAPGAPWYQQPLVWVGGGVGLLLIAMLAGGKR